MATVSGSIEVGAKGKEVSCDLALVAVVAAEAAAVAKTGGEEVGLGEAGNSPDFVRRHKFYSYPHFHSSPFPLPVTLPYESDKFRGVCHWPPETLSTA